MSFYSAQQISARFELSFAVALLVDDLLAVECGTLFEVELALANLKGPDSLDQILVFGVLVVMRFPSGPRSLEPGADGSALTSKPEYQPLRIFLRYHAALYFFQD